MNAEQRARCTANRLAARKKLLNKLDFCNFHRVPPFIIDAFFSEGSYFERLIVTTFAFLNGLTIDQLARIVRRRLTIQKWNKIEALYRQLSEGRYRDRYYSYCTIRNVVSYLNGVVKPKNR